MIKKFAAACLAVLILVGALPAQQKVRLFDTDLSHNLTFTWNENDSANRVLNFLVAGANRSLTISGDSYIDQDVRIAATPTWASAILNHASADTRLQFSLAGTPKWTVGLDVSDSNKFKVASGDEFGNSHDVLNIAAYDGSTAGVAEFTVADTWTPPVGDSIRGIAADGNYVYYADAGHDQIVKLDASTGAEVARSSAVTGGNIRGLAWGGDHVYVYNHDGTARIRQYLASDLSAVSYSEAWYGVSGICYWGGYLYACNSNDHDVKKIRCSDMATIWTAAFTNGSGVNQFDVARGITTDGVYLYVLDQNTNNRIVRLNISDGSWVDATAIPNDPATSYSIWTAGDWVYVVSDHGASDLFAEKFLRADMSFVEAFDIASTALWGGCHYGDYHYVSRTGVQRIYKYWFTSSASYVGSGITFRLPDEFGQTRDLAKLTGEGNLGIGTIFPEERLDVHGNIKASLGQFISTVPTGTAPASAVSTTQVDNWNSEYWAGQALPALESGKYLTNDGSIFSWAVPALNDLSDVNAAAPNDDDVLTFDTATGKWIAAAPAGGGAFTDLSDVPAAYTGDGGKVVKVKADETGLEFVAGGAGVTDFTDLGDVPATYVDQAGKYLKVNATEDALEFASAAGGGAPTDAQYLTLAANGDLSAERILAPQGLLKGVDGGAGNSLYLSHGLKYKAPTDTPDDDFTANALDGKWTVVDGASGTAALLGTAGNIYDLTTRDSYLLVQAINGDEFSIRQDYTLPDNSSITVALTPSVAIDAETGVANNEIWVGMSFNNDDSAFNAGTYQLIMWDTNADATRIVHWKGTVLGSTTASTAPTRITPVGQRMYFRICRSNLTYYGFISFDGETWVPMGSNTVAGAHNNLWLFVDCQTTVGTPVPIQAFDWVLLGTNAVDPW